MEWLRQNVFLSFNSEPLRTYYQDHVEEPAIPRPSLPNGEERTVDICVVGAGLVCQCHYTQNAVIEAFFGYFLLSITFNACVRNNAICKRRVFRILLSV